MSKKLVVLSLMSTMVCFAFVSSLLTPSATVASEGQRWTIEDILQGQSAPFAIGHRGYGANLPGDAEYDPELPIENTCTSVREAFRQGVGIVEVDVQITADGQVVAFHDDFLGDYSCLNSLTYHELKKRLPFVSRLKHVLKTALPYSNRKSRIGGLMIIEMKAPSPLCDPDDATEMGYTAAVVSEIQEARMTEQVMLESFSPTLLGIAKELAPEIQRQLALSVLQFMPPDMIAFVTGLEVTPIAKNDFGLAWAEIGQVYRLPGYATVEELAGVLFALEARSLSLDSQMDMLMEGMTYLLIETAHTFGLNAAVYTLNSAEEWQYFTLLGVDAIFIDDIPLGVELQGW